MWSNHKNQASPVHLLLRLAKATIQARQTNSNLPSKHPLKVCLSSNHLQWCHSSQRLWPSSRQRLPTSLRSQLLTTLSRRAYRMNNSLSTMQTSNLSRISRSHPLVRIGLHRHYNLKKPSRSMMLTRRRKIKSWISSLKDSRCREATLQ